MDFSTYLLLSLVYIPLNVFDLFIITRYMNTLYGPPQKGPYIKLLKIFIVLCASLIYAPYTALWGLQRFVLYCYRSIMQTSKKRLYSTLHWLYWR